MVCRVGGSSVHHGLLQSLGGRVDRQVVVARVAPLVLNFGLEHAQDREEDHPQV